MRSEEGVVPLSCPFPLRAMKHIVSAKRAADAVLSFDWSRLIKNLVYLG